MLSRRLLYIIYSFKALARLPSFFNLEMCRQTLDQRGKLSSVKEKQITVGTTYLEASLYNMLHLLNEKCN